MASNEAQVAFWNGIAGERWTEAQPDMDRTLAPLGQAALDAAELAPGHRVLDVGCGCGDTTLAVARRVGPSGQVTGVDVSAPMLARARERASALGSPATFALADAAVAPLPPVDRIVSRFGVMFFDDPPAAFAHLRRALVGSTGGGRLAFVCWRSLDQNPWAHLPAAALSEVLGPPIDPPPADAPGPFAFADPARIERILDAAGFSDAAIRPLDVPITWADPADDATLRHTFVRIGTAARRLLDAPEALREPAIAAILDRIRPWVRDGRLELPAAAWLVTAAA